MLSILLLLLIIQLCRYDVRMVNIPQNIGKLFIEAE